MRGLGRQYRDDMTELGILNKTLLVQTRVGRNGKRLDWCVDCRDYPSNSEIRVSKIFHHNRPPDEEQSSSENEYFNVSNEVLEQEISEMMEDLGLELLFSEEAPIDETEIGADGLSRRPPDDEDFDEVRMLRKKQSDGFVWAEESLPLTQQTDPELRSIVGFRLRSNEPPTHDELQTESELTKKLVTKWDRLLVINGLVYLRDKPVKPGEPTSLRLLLPRSGVDDALQLCDAGTVGRHFCSRKNQ